MNLRITHDLSNISWDLVPKILKETGMGYFDAEVHKRAFENSYTVVFVYDDDKLVGFGRAISDGAYQAGIYDVAVIPEYQGKGIGKMIIQHIIAAIPQCNFILYAAIGKERFYESLGFKKMKTGMALFKNTELMQIKGFIE
ncbi:GNAT family N-acetyltransferase [Clostridium peptidivorans]|uniref:GNAT family N-acetyltransferase n=1 Tax=Clostridium peptidivorans TaxID=100174 RepID=UPI000BE31B36|nr:GNAT family N-acetyltransferase [Clostridium peptidivorans]